MSIIDQSNVPLLRICKKCHVPLAHNTLPRCALANKLTVGPVPEELRDLTIVEEAMIARCRAKCWVIHLHDGDSGSDGKPSHLPTTQHGMKGHIIVYPSKPEQITHVLPPPMKEITTPICVLFVGSMSPSKEWLRNKAKPLIVCQEKVRAALVWLKQNNPLYSDVVIDHCALNCMPVEQIAPVDMTTQEKNSANESQGSQYDFFTSYTGCFIARSIPL